MKRILNFLWHGVICAGVISISLVGNRTPISGPVEASAQTAKPGTLEQAAKREGKLRIVATSSLKPMGEAFEKKFGIKVEGIYVGAPDVLRKVSEESEAGIFATDVFDTDTGPLGVKLNKWAQPFTPEGLEKVAKVKEGLPAGWHQTPVFQNVIGVAYNKDLVHPTQVPRSIFDLLKPEWKGKIISRTPWLGSNFIGHILSYYAWFNQDMNKWADYWSRFKQNVGRYEAQWPTLHSAVGLKEFALGVFSLQYGPTLWGRSYPGLAYATFKEPAIWWPLLAVVHNRAPHPNSAKLYVNFLVSDEGQRLLAVEGMVPANKDVPPKPDLQRAFEGINLHDNKLQGIFSREFMEREDEWKERVQKIYQ